jgi:GNAT superfamily N-acetyltransferase
MEDADLDEAVGLQKLAFPPPFSEELHWDQEHLSHHISLFPEGQLVAVADGRVVGTCSNTVLSDERWFARENWYRTVGGPKLTDFARDGTTLYGIDITVHPAYRRVGIGREFYLARFDIVKRHGLARYGTGCRIPDYHSHGDGLTQEEYARRVVAGDLVDRTLTPLLRYGLTFLGIIRNYMPDFESQDGAALLEREAEAPAIGGSAT